MVGIYKITSPTGKIYIGQSLNIEKRFRRYTHSDCPNQKILYKSFKKYKPANHNFEVVHQLPEDVDKSVLNAYEILYYEQYKECGFEMLNGVSPEVGYKSGPKAGTIVSKETRAKLSAANTGRIFSKEWRENISKGKTGKSVRGHAMSEETKKKLSEIKKGTKVGVDNPFYGKKHSPETLKKISDAVKGLPAWNKGIKTGPRTPESIAKTIENRKWYKHSEEIKAKMSLAMKGVKKTFKGGINPRKKIN